MHAEIRSRVLGLALLFLLPAGVTAAEFALEKTDRGVAVKLDGKLFTEYLTKTGAKPILWPIIGPTGQAFTRAYPMEKVEGEKADHPHQRSLWLTHGNVNGIDYWAETGKNGHIVHKEWEKIEGGKTGTIATKNEWIDPSGKKILDDHRVYTFSAGEDWRAIDVDVTLTATSDDVKFGDTKEGSFGVRVPTVLDVDQKGGSKGGHIVNSEGLTDKEAWGKRAPWVDYYGNLDGKQVGIAILNHPSSFRFPTYWHVRTYGLFAANPFGIRDFTGDKQKDGSYVLKKGESINLRHRVLLHTGDAKSAKIADKFAEYAKESKGK